MCAGPKKKVAALRFGVHGWCGASSTALTCGALVARLVGTELADWWWWLSLWAAATAALTAWAGLPLVGQAPVCTVIARNVVPPHREAFRRTGESVFYLSGRLVWQHLRPWYVQHAYYATAMTESVMVFDGWVDWAWGFAALLFTAWKFMPSPQGTEWRNGNTYVFVLPMAGGLLVDSAFQLPALRYLFQPQGTSAPGVDGPLGDWNEQVVGVTDLLFVLLSALLVAFAFTLAFRGVLDIRRCYWTSAALVHSICVHLTFRAIRFVAARLT